MSKVVSLAQARIERDNHNVGPAICKECSHEWTAVAPGGEVTLECPSCRTWKGLWKGGMYPEHELWVCDCGCDVFTISSTTNIICWRCGTIHGQQFFADGDK